MAKRLTPNSFKSVAQILNDEKAFFSLRETAKAYDITVGFEKIFPELKEIAQAIKVDKKVLYLKVENSVWKSELNLRKNIVMEKINKYFGEDLIKSIKFL